MPILYRDDFLRYPGSIVDTSSSNRSWVEFAGKLNLMGVKNWGFPLALINPDLQGIDPHRHDLDEFTMIAIMEECEHNHWYFFREVLRIKDTSGNPAMLSANRGNIAAYWCLWNNFVTMLEQIRQTGKSLFGRTVASWFHHVGVEKGQHILYTKSDMRADEIREYKIMRGMLPAWMYDKHPKDADNQIAFTTMSKENVTFTYIPAGDPTAANGVGRGKTPRLVQSDEGPFCPYSHISIPALVGSTSRTFTDCERDGTFHALFYTTTAGDLATEEGKYFFDEIRSKSMFFTEALYDCYDREEAVQMIFANSKNQGSPHVLIAFNHRQLGYTDEWLRRTMARVPGTVEQKKRDFLGIWTFGSSSNPIGERLLAKIRDHIDYEPKVVVEGLYQIRYYGDVETIRRTPVVMGMDTSNATGRDSITGVGIGVETMETLIAFDLNDTNLKTFSTWLVLFLKNHPELTLIPEARSSWDGIRDLLIIDAPLVGVDIGRRIYSRIVDNARNSASDERLYREYCQGQASERKYNPYRSAFGFPTNAALREILMNSILKDATREGPELIRDLKLIDELSSLIVKKGRIDHPTDGHDDHVISWLLAHWLIRMGRNLSHYGIDQSLIMSRVMKTELATPKQIAMKNSQDKKRHELKLLREQLASASTLLQRRYFEAKIKALESEISDDGTTSTEYNSIARTTEEARDKHITNARFRSKLSLSNPFKGW